MWHFDIQCKEVEEKTALRIPKKTLREFENEKNQYPQSSVTTSI